MIWDRAPFFRIVLPFILGILLSDFIVITSSTAFWMVGICVLAFGVLNFVKPLAVGFRNQWVYGMLLNLILVLFGYILTSSQSNLSEQAHFSRYLSERNQGVLLEVLKPITLKEKTVQAAVEIRKIADEELWNATVGKAVIYFQRDSLSEQLEVGDKCMASVSLERVKEPRNPGVFDYAQYLSRSDIYYSTYIRDNRWKVIGQDEDINLLKSLNAFRSNLEARLLEVGVTKEAHAVISALTLGDKNELSQELKTAYSKAGVLHILAVSGLHVGIFYLVMNFLLSFMEKLKNGKYLKSILVILALWGYVMLTGMSPSVMRAATMFSFVVVGTMLHKHTNIYNTLCVSAFFLLLFQPQSLFNVGFLLSYSAVFGIVYLYPKIYGLWTTKYWLLDKIWVLMSVSLAAQVITTPLSLHYFHQFPNYFLLSNIIVVPVATGIIYLTLVLFAVLPVQALAEPLASAVSYIVQLLNSFVGWIENLPFAVTDNIEIGFVEVILLYILIAGTIFYLNTRKYRYLIGVFSTVLLLMAYQINENNIHQSQQQLIVYDVPRHSAFDAISGTSSMLTADSSLIANRRTIGYVMENNWRQMGISERANRPIEEETSASVLAVLNGQRILLPLKLQSGSPGEKVKVDILILSNNCDCSIEGLNTNFDIGEIVLDSSIPRFRLKGLQEDCEKFGIPFYNVNDSGAFVRDF